jgi:monomeric sarcosine oxidase
MQMGSHSRYDIAVIGAGVFGAWTAWHLGRAGRRVILLDQYGPANVRASSGGESRVIRMAYGADAIYTRMSQRSLQWWHQVFAEVGRPELFQRTGVLWMARSGNRAAEQSIDALAEAQIEHEVLDADALRRRYPQIVVPDDGWAILEPGSGGLLARRAVQAVVADACARFGVHFSRAAVRAPHPGTDTGSIATGVDTRIDADVQIWACGPWLGQVFPELLGPRIFTTRQEVFYVGADPDDGRFAPPQMPTWMDFERDWYGLPDLEGRGFKLACDVHGPAIDPDGAERRVSEAGIAAARAFLGRRFPALARAPLIGSEVCQYENTSNGDFLIDRHPDFDNIWLIGGGSGHGFKHGPAVGEYVTQRLRDEIAAEPRFSLATKATRQARQVH